MTEIAQTQTTQTPDPAANGAAPAEAQSPAAQPDPAKAAADAEAAKLQAERQEAKDLADAKAREWRFQQELKGLQKRYEELETQRKADLDRISKAERWEKLSAEEALADLESRGLTAQQLGRAAVERGSPEEIERRATEKATAKARAEFEAELKRRDDEAKKKADEQAVRDAHSSFLKEVTDNKEKFPVSARMAKAGPVMRRALLAEFMHAYAMAADIESKGGKHYSDDEIKSELETYLSSEYKELTLAENGASLPNGTSVSGAPGSAQSVTSQNAATGSAGAPSVTDARGNDVASLTSDLPKDFKSWPAEKQNRYFVDQVRQRGR